MKSEKEIFEQYIKKVTELMDPSTDLCEDFFKYSAGKFDPNNCDSRPSSYWLTFGKIIKNEEISFPSFIKARNFYNSCKNIIDFKTFLQKTELYEEIGGWPAYDKNWSSKSFDWIKVAGYLASVGLKTIVKHKIEYSPEENIYTVSAKRFLKKNTKISEILKKLNVNEDRIPEIIGDIELVLNKIEQVPPQKFPRSNCIKIVSEVQLEKLRSKLGFDYVKYLETYRGKKLENTDIFRLENEDYLIKFLETFTKTESKSVANYIFFVAGVKFLKGKFPLNLTIEFFAPTLIASGFSTYFDESDKSKHNEVLDRFTKSFLKVKDEYDSDATRQVKQYKTEDIETQQYIESQFQQNTIDSMFKTLEIHPDNFIQNIKNLQNLGPTVSHKICFSRDFHDESRYYAALKLLLFATINHEKPILHHFIGNGFRMWRDIIYSFSDIENSKEYPNEIFEKQIAENNLPECYNVVNLSKAYALALQKIFNDYKLWLKDNQNFASYQDTVLKELGFNIDKIIFISYGQRECYKVADTITPAFLALLNNKHFTETFQCKLGSKMNKNNTFLI